MEYKQIIENGEIVEVKLFKENEIDSTTEESVKKFFDSQKEHGYVFLKAFKEGDKINSLFIKEIDYKKLCQK